MSSDDCGVSFRVVNVNNGRRDIDSFNRLKREVFVGEQGWHLPLLEDASAAVDDGFDSVSSFIIAYSLASKLLVGGVRATRASERFPRQEYFETLLASHAVVQIRRCLFTINALAVDRGWRGRLDSNRTTSFRLTLGCELMCRAIAEIWLQSGRVIVLSATPDASYRLFRKLGFRVLNRPQTFDSAPFPIINMALVLTEGARLQRMQSPLVHFLPAVTPSELEANCGEFFRQCEQTALEEKLPS